MKVLTVTLNPAIDQTVRLPTLQRGAVHRATSVRFDAGGKGVNVAACLADWGADVTATGLLGQDNAAPFEGLMRAKQIADRFVRVPGATRTNIKLVDAGETTDVNLPGFAATPDALAEAIQATVDQAPTADGVVIAGSLPPGAPADLYGGLLSRLIAAQRPVILDTSGKALALALPFRPHLVKPNAAELADLTGAPCTTIAEIARAARQVQATGVPIVVVSMGDGGALFCGEGRILHARLPAVSGRSTVGAGDAMVAGLAAALVDGGGLDRMARLGTAFAVAKLARAGANLPGREEIESLAAQVVIVEVGGAQ